jgi:hypothetical protein
MSGVLALLQEWLASAERLASRVPELARSLGAGSWPAVVLAGAAGLALLVAGARLGRFLAAAGGALVGWLVGGLLAPAVHGWMPAWVPAWVAAAVLGLVSLLAPDVYPITLGLVPGALLGVRLPLADKPWVGGFSGGLALGLVALWLRRLVLAGTAAVAGAVLAVASLLALSRQVPALLVLARRPMLLTGLAALLAVAGTAFQLGVGDSARKPRSRKVQGAEGG